MTVADELAERARVLKEAHDAFERTRSVGDALHYHYVLIGAQCEDLKELTSVLKLFELRLQAVEAYLDRASSPRPPAAN